MNDAAATIFLYFNFKDAPSGWWKQSLRRCFGQIVWSWPAMHRLRNRTTANAGFFRKGTATPALDRGIIPGWRCPCRSNLRAEIAGLSRTRCVTRGASTAAFDGFQTSLPLI
jgi:hypothetical protein